MRVTHECTPVVLGWYWDGIAAVHAHEKLGTELSRACMHIRGRKTVGRKSCRQEKLEAVQSDTRRIT